MISPDDRQQFIVSVARAFSEMEVVEHREDGAVALEWTRGDMSAGTGVNVDQAWVWLGDVTAPAASAEDAIGLLNAIFHDEIVAVSSFEGEICVSEALANASDLHMAPHLLMPFDPLVIVRVDAIHIRCWSGKLDRVQPWPPLDQ